MRVGVPGTSERRVAVAGSAGYGYTEEQAGEGGAHHRAFGSAAVAVAPLRPLELALRFDGRYDAHPDDGDGAHGGMVGDPRLLARLGTELAPSFFGGLETVVWAPGEEAPSIAFDAITVDAKVLGAYRARAGFTLGGLVGFRADRSSGAAPPLDRTRLGDRLSLGLSDSHAVLTGVGVSVPVATTTEILAEVTADWLVGGDVDSLASPIRFTGGARHALTDVLALEALAELSPSQRPDLGSGDPLVVVEPLFSLTLGVRYRVPLDGPPPPPPPAVKEPPPPEPTPPAPQPPEEEPPEPVTPVEPEVPPGEIRGLIRSFAGRGVVASIRVEPIGAEATSDASGAFAVDVPPGEYEVIVTADRYKEQRRKIRVEENGVTILNAELFEDKR